MVNVVFGTMLIIRICKNRHAADMSTMNDILDQLD